MKKIVHPHKSAKSERKNRDEVIPNEKVSRPTSLNKRVNTVSSSL